MIIFLYGEDSFRSHQKLLEIKNKYLQSDKSGSGLSLFDFLEATHIQDIFDVFSMSNLLAPKRLVMVKRLLGKSREEEQKEMLEYLKRHQKELVADQDLVVVFWEEISPRKNSALLKFLESTGKKQKFEKLIGVKINSWIIKRITELDPMGKISQKALDKLVAFCGNDTFLLDGEIRKLVDYSAGQMIGEEEIEIFLEANINANIFNTIDALANNNKKEAVKLLHSHLQKGEDPFYLLTMIIYQFRNLLKVYSLQEEGYRNEYEIAKAAKLHPYVVKKSMTQLRRFSFLDLKNIYAELGELDRKVKTGKIDMKLALDLFIAKI